MGIAGNPVEALVLKIGGRIEEVLVNGKGYGHILTIAHNFLVSAVAV